MLGQKFIKTGIIPKEFGQIYSDFFDFRQKGDYGDFFNFDAEKVVPLVPKVEKFLELVKTLLVHDKNYNSLILNNIHTVPFTQNKVAQLTDSFILDVFFLP